MDAVAANLAPLLAATLSAGTILALAALGLLINERAGIVNLGAEGMMLVAAIALVLGTGDFTLHFGGFALGGIGTATFGAIVLNALLSRGRP